MASIITFKKLALSFPNSDEHPHFHLQSVRVKKKYIRKALAEREQV